MHDEEPECEMEEKQKNDIQYVIEKVESYWMLRIKKLRRRAWKSSIWFNYEIQSS